MIRYNITCITRDGLRTLVGPAQGRFMRKTREEADGVLAALLSSNGERRLADVYGPQSTGTFRVDYFECWESGDPKGIYVDDALTVQVDALLAQARALEVVRDMAKELSERWAGRFCKDELPWLKRFRAAITATKE